MKETIDLRDVDELGPQKLESELSLPENLFDPLEVEKVGRVHVVAEVGPGEAKGEYVAEGRVDFEADLKCSRCLEPYPFANSSTFTVTYRPRPTVSEEDLEIEIPEGDLDVEFYEEPVVSLRELARVQIQLSLPMKPLHDEKCLGLCPECGADLNKGVCGCGEKQGDERWGALRDIREQLAKKREN